VRIACSGVKVHPFQVAVNTCPHDGHVWLLVCSPGTHAPSNVLPQPGQSSGECSVILIAGRSSSVPAKAGTGAAAAAVPGWLAIPVPVSRCAADPLARMI
jgi:hypothetical protein